MSPRNKAPRKQQYPEIPSRKEWDGFQVLIDFLNLHLEINFEHSGEIGNFKASNKNKSAVMGFLKKYIPNDNEVIENSFEHYKAFNKRDWFESSDFGELVWFEGFLGYWQAIRKIAELHILKQLDAQRLEMLVGLMNRHRAEIGFIDRKNGTLVSAVELWSASFIDC